jgi:DNA-binding NtrC family response regulator
MDCLLRYDWPGNVDELFELIAEAHRAATGPHISDQDLPSRIHAALTAEQYPRREEVSIQLDPFLTEVERELIQRALRVAKGNKARAARLLGVSRARLLRRIEALEIPG